MQRRVLLGARLLFVTINSAVAWAAGGEELLRVVIDNPVASPYQTGAPDIPGLKLTFGARLSNGSEKVVSIPEIQGERNVRPDQVSVDAVQAQKPDGTWNNLFASRMISLTATIKTEACTVLAPGKTADIGRYEFRLALLPRQLADLGREPIMRLKLTMFCQQSNGNHAQTSMTTDAFRLQLPGAKGGAKGGKRGQTHFILRGIALLLY